MDTSWYLTVQVQIYTWPDATLRELTDLVKEVQPAARRTTARLEFALIYPDKKGRNVLRVIGGVHSTRPGPDDIKTLKQLNFQVWLKHHTVLQCLALYIQAIESVQWPLVMRMQFMSPMRPLHWCCMAMECD